MSEIETRPFFTILHLTHLNAWLAARNLPPVDHLDLPKIGLVAETAEGPIAAAFVRHCEGNVGMIDGLVTKPSASSMDRHQAIDRMIERLLLMAREAGIKRLFAFSVDDGTLKRSEKHGFKKTNYSVISQIF